MSARLVSSLHLPRQAASYDEVQLKTTHLLKLIWPAELLVAVEADGTPVDDFCDGDAEFCF